MKTTIFVQDIECDACIKVIERTLKKLQGINQYTILKDSVIIDYDPSLIKLESIIESISLNGYKASTYPLVRMSYKQRLNDFFKNKNKYKIEKRMFLISGISFVILSAIELLLYFALFTNNSILFKDLWPWLLYLNISVVSISASIWHLKAYKAAITSMTGMMLGMTLGMQSGFMIGAIIGATNGMFMGSVVGTVTGVLLGIFAGKDSGIMGAMQGMMSGLMGGTMGAMTAVMLLTDHLQLFMPLFMLINVIIMWAMSYMTYEEIVEDKKVKILPADFTTFLSYEFVFIILIAFIMIYGPRSLLTVFS